MKRTVSPSTSSRPRRHSLVETVERLDAVEQSERRRRHEADEAEEPPSALRDAAEPVGDELVQRPRQDERTVVAHAAIPFEPAGKLERVERIPARRLDEATDHESRIGDAELVHEQSLGCADRERADLEDVDRHVSQLAEVEVGRLAGTHCEETANGLRRRGVGTRT